MLSASAFPFVRGRITENAPLAQLTWFRVGGPADILFKPADQDDLISFLRTCPANFPITVLGVASNIIIRDGGIEGVVIRLGREFAEITPLPWGEDVTRSVTGEGFDTNNPSPEFSTNVANSFPSPKEGCFIECGAAALDLNVAITARDAGIGGLEFLSGIPGTIGGALRMNAGAYGREMKDVLVSAKAIDRQGNLHTLTLEDMKFSYRHSGIPDDWIFTRAVLQGTPEDKIIIQKRMDEIQSARESSQPTRARTGGSTFANPPNQKAWKLIDESGCRGLNRGEAQVSELHCNFMINTGNATAEQLENLGEEVRARVLAKTGIALEWEIKRIGRFQHNAQHTEEEQKD